MKTIRELNIEKEKIQKDWDAENIKLFGSLGGYSQPVHQLKAIDKQIKNQRIINCGKTCNHCQADGVHYEIEKGSYIYYCPACDKINV